MINDNLNKKTIKGLLTMSASSGIVFILQFITTMILARIFSPSEFGIVSAITIVTSYTDIFWKIGIGPAIVQKKVLSKKDVRTGFTTSIAFGFIATISVITAAPLLIRIINIKESFVLQIIAFSFIINSFGVVPISILQREMLFGIIIKKDILSSLLYAIVAVILGVTGLGVWALAIALLSKYTIATVIAWRECPIRPSFGFEKKSFKTMMYFGVGYSLSQFLSVTTNQGDYFVVTRVMGSYALGIYSKAYQLMTVPANLFGQVLDQVFFPVMSKIQDDNQRLGNIFVIASALLALLYFPLGAGIYLFSKEIVKLLLGSEWIESAMPLSILALSSFFRVGHKINDPLFRAKGAVYNRALLHLIQAVITIIMALIGIRWGLLGVSIGVCISLILNYIIISFNTHKLIKFKVSTYFRCILPMLFFNFLIIPIMKFIEKLQDVFLSNELVILICLMCIYLIISLIYAFIVYNFIWPEKIKTQLNELLQPFIMKFYNLIKACLKGVVEF